MNTDVERYRICIQCIEENENRFQFPILVKNVVKFRIKTKIWLNPLCCCWWYYGGERLPEIHQLCSDCPYVLEHTVIGDREVHESRC